MYKIYTEKLEERDREWYEVVALLLQSINDLEMKLKEEEESEATLRGQIREMEKDREKNCYREKVESAHNGKRKKLVASVVAVTVLVGVGSMVAGWWFRS